MSEPVYIYNREHGWIPEPEVRFAYAHDRYGKKVIIYDRLPKPGEYFACYNKTETKWCIDESRLNFEGPISWLKYVSFDIGDCRREDDDFILDPGVKACTFVYL